MEFRPTGFNLMPPIVKNLLVINGLVFVATFLLGNQFNVLTQINDLFALHYWGSEKFKIWQLITHMFMHGNFGHIFSNMFALWMFGSILENHFGPKRFLTFYMLCGIGAALLHLGVLSYEYGVLHDAISAFNLNPTFKNYSSLLNQNPLPYHELKELQNNWIQSPMDEQAGQNATSLLNAVYKNYISQETVGSSGAVFGILFAFGYLFPNTELYLYFIPIPIKAKYFVAAYALFELYSGVRNSAGDNIAHFAHLGGMLVAFIILKIWNQTNRKTLY